MAVPDLARTLTIGDGETESEEFILTSISGREIQAITIFAPATLPETVNLYACASSGSTYRLLQSDGTDIAIPANKATSLTHLPAWGLKLVAMSAPPADRVFELAIRFYTRGGV